MRRIIQSIHYSLGRIGKVSIQSLLYMGAAKGLPIPVLRLRKTVRIKEESGAGQNRHGLFHKLRIGKDTQRKVGLDRQQRGRCIQQKRFVVARIDIMKPSRIKVQTADKEGGKHVAVIALANLSV